VHFPELMVLALTEPLTGSADFVAALFKGVPERVFRRAARIGRGGAQGGLS
jgi:hypothetical protein